MSIKPTNTASSLIVIVPASRLPSKSSIRLIKFAICVKFKGLSARVTYYNNVNIGPLFHF